MQIDVTQYATMPLEQLKTELPQAPWPVKYAAYEWLEKNRKEDAKALRSLIEARRGITRDEAGKIIRSDDWKKERVKLLQAKVEEYKQRIKNAQAEIKQLGA